MVIARADQLAEHLPAAWATIGPRVADPAQRGEFVIVTGPSRTADIEKILILGVHGPKRLIVIIARRMIAHQKQRRCQRGAGCQTCPRKARKIDNVPKRWQVANTCPT